MYKYMLDSSILQKFIETANIVHNHKYNYDKVIYINSSTPVIITCLLHNDFPQRPNDHTQGQGCPKCGLLQRIKKRTPTTEQFIEKAKLIHDNKYDYSLVNYINNHTHIIIICSLCGPFPQAPNHHLNGQGCPNCCEKGKKVKTLDEFIKQAKKIHGNKYDYSKFVYSGATKKGIIICPLKHEFEQTPSNHLSGQGCRKCGRIVSGNKQRKTTEEFIKDAKETHGNEYDYSQSNYINAYTNVYIICKHKHGFWQNPNQHIQGAGCPRCFNTISKKRKFISR